MWEVFMVELKEYLEATAREISDLPMEGQKYFMGVLARCLENQDEIIMELIGAMMAKTGRYHKSTKWIRKRLEKNMTLTPKRVAEECVYYLGVNSKMMPFLIKTSQRIKDRIRHRRSYAAHR